MCSKRLALPRPGRRSALAKLFPLNISFLAAMAIKKETWHQDIIAPACFSSEVLSFGHPTQDLGFQLAQNGCLFTGLFR